MMMVIFSGVYGITVYAALPQGLSDARSEMTGPQMIDAVNSLDKQIQGAAQPLSDADSEVVMGSLGEDPFGGGVWRRLTGSYPRCGNRRALQIMRGGSPERRASSSRDRAGGDPARAQGGGAAAGAGYVQRRALLEIWLYVHIPLTFVLIAALLAHVISVFFYW